MVRKNILYELNYFKFVEACFVAWNMVYLGKCWVEYFINSKLIKLIDSVHIFYILTDFLSIYYISYYKGVQISLIMVVDFYSFLHF